MLSKITIVGGGLAGLATAIELRRGGVAVEVFEKRKYPCVKLCGEFLSLEGVAALARLTRLDLRSLESELNLVPIDTFTWVSRKGRVLEMPLEPRGYGVRRDRLDFWMANHAKELGARVRLGETYSEPDSSTSADASGVLWANGKDHGESPFFAVKGYCKGESKHAISLYQLSCGYIGFTRMRGELSYCALLDRRRVDRTWKFTNWQQLLDGVFTSNPYLASWASAHEASDNAHVGAARFDFKNRPAVRDGRWHVGDAVQVVPPFVGDGMAMALEGGELVARSLLASGWDAAAYENAWRKSFSSRIRVAKLLHPVLWKGALHEAALSVVAARPGIAAWLYKHTRGPALAPELAPELANEGFDC